MAFQFAAGDSLEQLVARFEAAGSRGAILGPHGSGKSTLLETIKPRLAQAGWNVAAVALRAGARRLPPGFLQLALGAARPLVIVDGYEQLTFASRCRLWMRCRWAAAGLLVTSHAPVGIPVIHRTQVTRALALKLVSTLTQPNTSLISLDDVAASHASCGSNLRELFFALYLRHEALVASPGRAAQTATAAAT